MQRYHHTVSNGMVPAGHGRAIHEPSVPWVLALQAEGTIADLIGVLQRCSEALSEAIMMADVHRITTSASLPVCATRRSGTFSAASIVIAAPTSCANASRLGLMSDAMIRAFWLWASFT